MAYNQPSPPQALQLFQSDFGRTISTPFDFSTGTVKHQREKYRSSIVAVVEDRPEVLGIERLDVYNQQYWFRLLTAMQEDFPLLRHAITVWDFNQLVSEYLSLFPSKKPSLNNLIDEFMLFLEMGHKWNTALNKEIAELETTFLRSFTALQGDAFKPITQEELLGVENKCLLFQSPFALFSEEWNCMENRAFVFKDDEDLLKPTFVEKPQQWVLFQRDAILDVVQINETQYALLSLLQRGETLGDAIELASESLTPIHLEELKNSVGSWFAKWISLGWFVGLT